MRCLGSVQDGSIPGRDGVVQTPDFRWFLLLDEPFGFQ